jgi:hypothetical protein
MTDITIKAKQILIMNYMRFVDRTEHLVQQKYIEQGLCASAPLRDKIWR